MKRTLYFTLAAGALVTGFYFYSSDSESGLPQSAEPIKKIVAPDLPQYPTEIVSLPIAQSLGILHSTEQSPAADLTMLQSVLQGHRRIFGGNPVGLNDEITAALTGKNLNGVASIPANHPSISASGELLDRWGTPYRFHALSAKQMEIRSAGPDQSFFTGDDLQLGE